MIYITGDTHRDIDFDKLKVFFKNKKIKTHDYLIILGDAGIIWNKNNEDTIKMYESLNIKILYIDGNHENFDILNNLPCVSILDACAHKVSNNIYHICRGEILFIDGITFLCIGGAESIDKLYRTENVSWWKDERIIDCDIDNAKYNLCKYNNKVDYVLTHCAPELIVKKLGFKCDDSVVQLTNIHKVVKTKKWFFGHYHIDKTFNKTFRCLYNDVVEIENIHKRRESNYHLLTRASSFDDYKHYPYLVNYETSKKTQLIEDDLPEWYFHNFSYRDYYYCTKGVKDVAYVGSPFDNHICKDSRIYISFDKKIEKNEKNEPVDKYDETLISTWRCDLVAFTNYLEKYSPDLDTNELKARINLTYDQYNRNEDNWRNELTPRPFLNTNIKINDGTKYSVKKDENILCNFFELENAKDFCEFYIKHNLKIHNFKFQKRSSNFNYLINEEVVLTIEYISEDK